MWPSIRAGLITLVLFFCLVEAAPLPMLKKHHLNRQVAQDETDRWVGILGEVGIDVDREVAIGQVSNVLGPPFLNDEILTVWEIPASGRP